MQRHRNQSVFESGSRSVPRLVGETTALTKSSCGREALVFKPRSKLKEICIFAAAQIKVICF
jgi:hypothetical protein